jgi:hypothetical protein
MEPLEFSSIDGMNTRAPAHALNRTTQGGANVLIPRELRNLLVTDAGTLQTRPGFSRVVTGADVHSLWSNGKDRALFVDGTVLKDFNGTTLHTGIQGHVSADVYGEDIYWSDGAYLGCIHNGANHLAALAPPNPAPMVSPTTGALPPGLYQVAFTISDDRGESPSAWPIAVDLPNGGGLSITGLPAVAVNVYVAPAGSTVLQFYAKISDPIAITAPPQLGHTLQTEGLMPMPPGKIVRAFNGRLLVARGKLIYFSEPFAPALHRPVEGFIPFPDRVTMVRPNDEGVYVGTTKATYWLAGADIAKAELVPVLRIGAAEHSDSLVDDEAGIVQWFSHDGLVRGDRAGQITEMQADTAPADSATRAATHHIDQGGTQYSVATSTRPSSAASIGSFMDAEIA